VKLIAPVPELSRVTRNPKLRGDGLSGVIDVEADGRLGVHS
jgi:hypothetical protein